MEETIQSGDNLIDVVQVQVYFQLFLQLGAEKIIALDVDDAV